ncbi:MAG: pilus assembly protein N-terminal domain-containing protein, partial [Pseudomonadota bacterium]
MFKQKEYKQNKVANNLNKSLQLTTLIIGLLLINSPALARKTAPAAASQDAVITAKEDGCVGQIANPAKLILPLGKSTLIKLPEPLATRSIGNPEVVQAKLITPQTLYLLGLDIGSTNMIIQGKSGTCTIIDVTVSMDPDGLQQMLGELLPEEKNIKATAAADSIILSGTVEDAITANRAVDIASAYVRRRSLPLNVGSGGANGNQNNQQNNQQQNMTQQNTDMVNPRIVNMLSVSAQQQVMLEVKVAEVSKTLLDKLGANLSLSQTSGSWTYRLITNFLSTAGAATGGAVSGFKNSDKNFALDAEKRDGLIKILAEPSIMAISGQEGSFLAGGTIFIPVSQNNNNGIPTITLEEKEFGVGVKFTPTVLAGGRINLRVSPEVSELNREGV